MQSGDVRYSAEMSREVLLPARDADWSVAAGDLDWSCQRTLDHIVDTLLLYASYVATRSEGRRQPIRNGDAAASVTDLLDHLDAAASMLDLVCDASPPPSRAFHPSGYSDADGFRAMACSEILTHTDDVAQGLGLEFRPSEDLCERIMGRVFPWAPDRPECPDRWLALRWCYGRTALLSRERLDELWWWHAAPLSEWDGSRNQRTAPPAWQ